MGWRMPAEWEPHERTVMAWPTDVRSWGSHLEAARRVYAGLADAILSFEPLTMMVNPGEMESAGSMLPGGVDLVEIPFDTAWARDWGPMITIDDHGARCGVDFAFNSWGAGHGTEPQSEAGAAAVLDHLGIERVASPMVLEGGAITVDGRGTLITTEQCLLNPNRNPEMSRAQIEDELRRTLGVEKVVWLPLGIAADLVTDGHVDAVATFAAPGVVVLQGCTDPNSPDYERMAANRTALEAATDVDGRPFEIIELPNLPSEPFDGVEIGVAYANVVCVNGGVILATGGYPEDELAVEVLGRAFPGREVVGVPGALIAYAGGGPHCTTQQIPSARGPS